jgi:flagellar hook-associated protein 2
MTNRITGLNSGLDTESLITALTSRYQTTLDKNKGGQTKLEWKQDRWKTTNKAIVDFYNGSLEKLRWSTAYRKKITTASNESALSITTGSNAMVASHTISSTKMARSSYLTSNEIHKQNGEKADKSTTMEELGIADGTVIKFKMGADLDQELSITLNSGDTMSSLADKLNSAATESGIGISANFDEKFGRLHIASKKTGVDNQFKVDMSAATDALSTLGITDQTISDQYQKASDAEIVMDGVTYKDSGNTMDINGMTITIKQDTNDAFTVETKDDTSGVYDMVKGFLKDYNELIKSLETLYNADKASKYDILTSDQKEAMTDDEIKDWNDKIKSGLLSKDKTLGNVISALKKAMSGTYSIGGSEDQTASLATFGIATAGYFDSKDNERGMYHIDGDPDDSYSSNNTDLLKAAIAARPEEVEDFFMNLSKEVYRSLGNLMKGTEYSSAFTVYEDKLMASQYSDYNSKISDAEKALEARQDYYYKKFASMETALAKINSTSASFGNMLGY